jgi:hypothetical protein
MTPLVAVLDLPRLHPPFGASGTHDIYLRLHRALPTAWFVFSLSSDFIAFSYISIAGKYHLLAMLMALC